MFRKLIDFLRGTETKAIAVADEKQGDAAPRQSPEPDNFEFSTTTETEERAEAAMPGTSDIELKLHLTPPLLDLDILDVEANRDPDRSYFPDPIAECAVNYSAARPFNWRSLLKDLTRDFRQSILSPTFYVVTRQGRTTFMTSDAPDECIALVAAWDLREDQGKGVDDLVAASRRLSQWLAARTGGFESAELDRAKVTKQLDIAHRIEAIRPETVSIVCFVDQTAAMMDGRRVWHVLYSMGFTWGDMDCFQWADPTHQVDYLIWAEFNDEKYGYVLPEEVAAGRQNFRSVNFTLTPSRTPAPDQVLEQLILAAGYFTQQMGCKAVAMIDGEAAENSDALRKAVTSLIADYRALNLKPAMSSVLQLR